LRAPRGAGTFDAVIHDEILALELSLATEPGRSSPEYLERVVSDEFREFGASGRIYTKSEAVAALLSQPSTPADKPTPAPELLDFRVQEITPGVVLATYRTRLSLRSSIWRREGEAWRLFFHQGTVAPPAGGTV
jgi:hypothetical protein